MKRTTLISGMVLLLIALGVYAKPNVIVADTEGKPIQGASVEQITPSMNVGSKLTDKNGKVEVPTGLIQKTAWISVTKAGYIGSGHINFDQPKPIKITLKLSTKTIGERPGAGQPATRSVVEPEGDDKPQPEAEELSR